jgi:hypothetical protein
VFFDDKSSRRAFAVIFHLRCFLTWHLTRQKSRHFSPAVFFDVKSSRRAFSVIFSPAVFFDVGIYFFLVWGGRGIGGWTLDEH